MLHRIILNILIYFIKRQPRFPVREILETDGNHFAVVCTGGIGDVLMCTPAFRAIKETFPESLLTAIVHYKKEPVLTSNTQIDRLLGAKKSFFAYAVLLWKLKQSNPKQIVVFHANDPLVLAIVRLICQGTLIGFKTDGPLNFSLDQTLEFDNSLHVVQNNLRLMSCLEANTSNLEMELNLPSEGKQKAEDYFKDLGPNSVKIGYQLGANFQGKLWPIQNYINLGNRLIEEKGATLFVFGVGKELHWVYQICAGLKGKPRPVKEDLIVTSHVINSLDVLITPDTGPMHMAFALDCQTVALFGPTNPKNFGPLTHPDRHRVLQRVTLDQPLMKSKNDQEDWMGLITPQEVYQAVTELLNGSGKSS